MKVENLNNKAFIISQLKKMRESKSLELFSFFIDITNDNFIYDKNYLNNYISKYINFLENCNSKLMIRDKILKNLLINRKISELKCNIYICINDFWILKKEGSLINENKWSFDLNDNYNKMDLTSNEIFLRVKFYTHEKVILEDYNKFKTGLEVIRHLKELINTKMK